MRVVQSCSRELKALMNLKYGKIEGTRSKIQWGKKVRTIASSSFHVPTYFEPQLIELYVSTNRCLEILETKNSGFHDSSVPTNDS